MIIQIDHIAFSSLNFKRFSCQAKRRGYKMRFFEKNLPNCPAKKELMKNAELDQDIAFFDKPESVAIEYLNHRHLNRQYSPMKAIWEKFGNGTFKLNKIKIKTADVDASSLFWQNFNFKPFYKDTKKIMLEFTSLINKNIFQLILLKAKPPKHKFYLEDKGVSCVAFITSSVSREREALRSQGYRLTEVNKIYINKKSLCMFFVVGPAGEIVEIIGDIKNETKTL